MKFFFKYSLLLSAVAVASLFHSAPAAPRWSPSLKDAPIAAKPAFHLVHNGQPKATIIIAQDALDTNREAATLLQESVRKISGATLPIADDSKPVNGPAILIGRSKPVDVLKLAIPSGYSRRLDEEGYLIRQIGNQLVLAGNDHRPNPAYKGSLFATVELLQRLGCRWYFPGEFGAVFPRSQTISLPLLNETVKPSFPVRGFWYSVTASLRNNVGLNNDMERWMERNRYMPYGTVLPSAQDGSIMRPFEKWERREIGGKVERVNVMFEKHPEYFALKKDGTRDRKYVCLSHPAVLDLITAFAFDYFEKNPDNIAFGISPPDGAPTCECPDCQAANQRFMQKEPANPRIQDISGGFYLFLNRLAKRIEQKYPTKLVSSLAYSGRIRPPENLVFNKNITIRTALLAHSRHHRYDQPITWQTKERVQLYKRWAELIDLLVEREFYPVFQFSCEVPQPMYSTSIANIRQLKQLRFKGMEWEGKTSFFPEGATNYIRGQLLWNVETDTRALLEDYYTRFYGKAGPVVRKFDEAVENALTQSLVDHHEEERIPEIYPHPLIVRITDAIGDVEKLVAHENDDIKKHVAYFKLRVEHFRCYSDMRHAETKLDFKRSANMAARMIEIEKIVNNINLTFISSSLQSRDSNPVYGELGANASAYGKLKQYLAKQKLLDGTEGELVAALPETWQFKTDPHNEGVLYEWHRADLAKDGWRDMKTTASWEIQGMQDKEARGYDGYAWYRTSVTIPQKFRGKKLTLFLGGFNNQAWIWVNNKLVATVPYHEYWARYKYHAQIDLTGHLEPGKNNRIAIRLWNDQGFGGLFRRSFIYSPK